MSNNGSSHRDTTRPRPVCMQQGEVKMAAYLVNKKFKNAIQEVIGRNQLGFKTLGGTEAHAHVHRATLEKHKNNVIITLDLGNAYGNGDAEQTISIIERSVTGMAALALEKSDDIVPRNRKEKCARSN